MSTSLHSVAYWWQLDMASDQAGGMPLANVDSDGLVFTGNANYYQLYLPAWASYALDGSYQAYVGALNNVIAGRPDLAGYSVTLDYANSKMIFLMDGTLSSPMPAIVLHGPAGVDVTPLGFHHDDQASGSYYVYGALEDGPITVSTDVDTVVGTSGNDFLYDTYNNTIFEGGYGIDTAVFNGVRTDYTVSVDSLGRWTVRSFFDGTDSLSSIERLQFYDKTLALDIDGNAGQAYRLYQAAFNRTPDVSGLTFQTHSLDDGWGLSAIAKNFIDSPEFSRTYGSLNNTQFVTQLYLNVLHRFPDAGGLQYHVDHLNQGWARENVLVGFSESPENQVAVIGAIQNGIELIG